MRRYSGTSNTHRSVQSWGYGSYSVSWDSVTCSLTGRVGSDGEIMRHFKGPITTAWARITGAEDIVRGIRYRVTDALLLAMDGHYDLMSGECDRPSRLALFLFRGVNRHYFTLRLSDWQDETDRISPCSVGDAMATYRDLEEKVLTWEEAFPEVSVQDA